MVQPVEAQAAEIVSAILSATSPSYSNPPNIRGRQVRNSSASRILSTMCGERLRVRSVSSAKARISGAIARGRSTSSSAEGIARRRIAAVVIGSASLEAPGAFSGAPNCNARQIAAAIELPGTRPPPAHACASKTGTIRVKGSSPGSIFVAPSLKMGGVGASWRLPLRAPGVNPRPGDHNREVANDQDHVRYRPRPAAWRGADGLCADRAASQYDELESADDEREPGRGDNPGRSDPRQ